MFPLSYQSGEIGFCNFTKLERMEITLQGEAFPHLLFHYLLTWSGWACGQVIHGSESLIAPSEGLQNALAACGVVLKELRTDQLSAASRNRDGSYALDITLGCPMTIWLKAHCIFRAATRLVLLHHQRQLPIARPRGVAQGGKPSRPASLREGKRISLAISALPELEPRWEAAAVG
jgi:hypothetical protein